MTVWVQEAVFPEASLTYQVTMVVPWLKAVGALFQVEVTPQLSWVCGFPRLTLVATHKPGVVGTSVRLAGQEMVGA